MAMIARQHPKITLLTKDAFGWSDLCQCDAVFLQRPCVKVHCELAKMAKQLNLPIWVDYDDAIDIVPCSNPKWNDRLAAEWADSMHKCLEMADVVTTVNDYLGERVSKFTKGRIFTIPNAHNDYVAQITPKPRTKTVLWRGGSSHDEDLMMVLPELAAVASNNPDWQFHFVGNPCWEARRLMPKQNSFFKTDWHDYYSYLESIAELAPSIQIVPWCDSSFNRCKSNLAWLEATSIGAVTVAPEWADEFNLPGVVRYGANFGETLATTMMNVPSIDDSKRCLSERFLLSKTNEKRLEIIRGI